MKCPKERKEITLTCPAGFGRSVSFTLVHGDPARFRSFLSQNQPTNQQPQHQPYPDFPPRMPAKLDP